MSRERYKGLFAMWKHYCTDPEQCVNAQDKTREYTAARFGVFARSLPPLAKVIHKTRDRINRTKPPPPSPALLGTSTPRRRGLEEEAEPWQARPPLACPCRRTDVHDRLLLRIRPYITESLDLEYCPIRCSNRFIISNIYDIVKKLTFLNNGITSRKICFSR